MRTDELGHIIIISNGRELSISQNAFDETKTEIQYIGNKKHKSISYKRLQIIA